MTQKISVETQYKRKDGTIVPVPFSYPDFSTDSELVTIEIARSCLDFFRGETGVRKTLQQTAKENAGNNERERAKIRNGDSSRTPQSEEEKAQKKAERAELRSLLDVAKAQGKTVAELIAMVQQAE